jgi:hypothetical protein
LRSSAQGSIRTTRSAFVALLQLKGARLALVKQQIQALEAARRQVLERGKQPLVAQLAQSNWDEANDGFLVWSPARGILLWVASTSSSAGPTCQKADVEVTRLTTTFAYSRTRP